MKNLSVQCVTQSLAAARVLPFSRLPTHLRWPAPRSLLAIREPEQDRQAAFSYRYYASRKATSTTSNSRWCSSAVLCAILHSHHCIRHRHTHIQVKWKKKRKRKKLPDSHTKAKYWKYNCLVHIFCVYLWAVHSAIDSHEVHCIKEFEAW